MDQAIMGRGGDLVVCLAKRLRFWTVAVSRNSSLAPVRPAQSEPDHREDVLGLAKQRFDLLAFTAGDSVGLGLHQSAGNVTGLLVGVATGFGAPGDALGQHFAFRGRSQSTLAGDIASRCYSE